jgi:calcineurin-like phosphoesterase family protein
MKWFTADWHLWHENMLHLCNRPFDDASQELPEIEDVPGLRGRGFFV